jgi:hypothetical protein
MFRDEDIDSPELRPGACSLLSARGKWKFGVQRVFLASLLVVSAGMTVGLLAWCFNWEREDGKGAVMASALDLMQTRAEAMNDAQLLLAGFRKRILATEAKVIARDADTDSRTRRLHNLRPLYDQQENLIAEAKAASEVQGDGSPVTFVEDPRTGKKTPLNATPDGRLQAKVLLDFLHQDRTMSDLLWFANRRAQAEASMDVREAVQFDIQEIQARVFNQHPGDPGGAH